MPISTCLRFPRISRLLSVSGLTSMFCSIAKTRWVNDTRGETMLAILGRKTPSRPVGRDTPREAGSILRLPLDLGPVTGLLHCLHQRLADHGEARLDADFRLGLGIAHLGIGHARNFQQGLLHMSRAVLTGHALDAEKIAPAGAGDGLGVQVATEERS